MSDQTIKPLASPPRATLSPPGSKSLTNRALVIGALAEGASALSNVLLADDTEVMIESLQRLGFDVRVDSAARTVRIEGRGGRIATASAELFCRNSGTTIRFLTAMCALGRGRFALDGIERMRQRPIAELVEMMRNLGARIDYAGDEGFPPLIVEADGLPGGLLRYGQARSSQYLSAVLMASPLARNELQVDLEGRQTSWPYVAMTMRLMDLFGVTPELVRDPDTAEPVRIHVPRGTYAPMNYRVEPDASNAGYFLAIAAIHPGSKLTIEGLGRHSLQGDVAFADVLGRMGAEVEIGIECVRVEGADSLMGIDADMSAIPDMAQTLAVTALFAEGPTRMTGIQTLRVKETDRIAALATELTKLGARVEVEGDSAMTITPPVRVNPASIDTYDDHRMAMSFAVAGTRAAGIVIRDSECVSKTYPQFFVDLMKLQ